MTTATLEDQNPLSMVAKVTTLPHLVFGILPVIGYLLGGGIFHWLTLFVYLGLTLIDPMVGNDETNHNPADEAQLEGKLFYRIMLWATAPAAILVTLFGHWVLTQTPLTVWEIAGMLVSLALATGFLATVAHELCHHYQPIDRLVGDILFVPIFMCDFHIYHNFHHHTHVATPNDPASARYGEPIYPFLIRSIIKKTQSAWQIEKLRMERNGKPTWHPTNLMARFIVMQAAWVALLVGLFGLWSIPICLFQYAFPRLLLAVADYLEHYGLGRNQLADGSYEKVRPNHAWDDSTLVSSMLFCQIDRHSDHHANVSRPYQILRVMEDAPRLPHGYLTMIPIALIPALWRRRMHPIVEAYYDKGGVIPYAVPGSLPEKYAAMVPEGWGWDPKNSDADNAAIAVAQEEAGVPA